MTDFSDEQLLSRGQLESLLGVSSVTLWEWSRRGHFPKAIRIGLGAFGKVRWRRSEIDAWLASRPRQKLKGDQPKTPRTRLRTRRTQ